jgi:hypothetical protein
MLISNVGQVVGTVDSVPLPVVWEVNWSQWLSDVLNLWCLGRLSAWGSSIDSASTSCQQEEKRSNLFEKPNEDHHFILLAGS